MNSNSNMSNSNDMSNSNNMSNSSSVAARKHALVELLTTPSTQQGADGNNGGGGAAALARHHAARLERRKKALSRNNANVADDELELDDVEMARKAKNCENGALSSSPTSDAPRVICLLKAQGRIAAAHYAHGCVSLIAEPIAPLQQQPDVAAERALIGAICTRLISDANSNNTEFAEENQIQIQNQNQNQNQTNPNNNNLNIQGNKSTDQTPEKQAEEFEEENRLEQNENNLNNENHWLVVTSSHDADWITSLRAQFDGEW